MTNRTQQTVKELIPALGATVSVRFEELTILCTVVDAKNSWGRVRLLVAPVAGTGKQWIELGRLVRMPLYACDACAQEIERGGITDDEGFLVLNGRVGTFHAPCELCGGAATHEVEHREVK